MIAIHLELSANGGQDHGLHNCIVRQILCEVSGDGLRVRCVPRQHVGQSCFPLDGTTIVSESEGSSGLATREWKISVQGFTQRGVRMRERGRLDVVESS